MSRVGNKALKWAIRFTADRLIFITSLSETNSRSSRQEASRDLRNPTFLYHVHKNLPLNPLLCKLTAVSSVTPCFFNMIRRNDIITRTSKSRKWSIPLFFRTTFCRVFLFISCMLHAPSVSIPPCMALQPLLGSGLPQNTPQFFSIPNSSPPSSCS